MMQIRNAFDIRRAISEISKFKSKSIGHVVAKIPRQEWPPREHRVRNTEYACAPTQLILVQEILQQLQAIADFASPYTIGTFETVFHLRVTRLGCEFDGDVAPESKSIENLLPDWFKNAAISGYGDMGTLQTKVDPTVRDAKEIPASEFTVSPSLLETIRETWATSFVPRDVRVETYKIHLYGPGGRFKAHRDTPEVGLVGTFLVGLGDTSASWDYDERRYSGNFLIGEHALAAKPCSWVAFHPDVPHTVSEISRGHRAVIAFKIFHSGASIDEQKDDAEIRVEARLKAVLQNIPPPFGILLKHMYHLGVSQLNGFDAMLFSTARKIHQVAVHVLPVVIKSDSTVYYDVPDPGDSASILNSSISTLNSSYDTDDEGHLNSSHDTDDEGHVNSYISSVYPLTPAHVDIILSGSRIAEARAKVKWLDDVEDVPLYSWDFKKSTAEWERDDDQINFTGNEADGENVTCVYLSHALLVLASNGDS
jgi:hypothetical protein